MPVFIFSKKAKKRMNALDPFVRKKLEEKLHALKDRDALPAHLLPLTDMEPATHRLKVQDYRFILERMKEDQFLVIDVDNRKDVYKR